MRSIKFRVWDNDDKCMISPDYITRDGRGCWKSNSIPTGSDKLMQFTGLLDKNGKEIYEGDIVTWPGWDGINYQVCYDRWGIPALAGVNCMEGTDFKEAEMNANATPEKCVVLGNIYEHKNLLEAKK